MKYAIIDISGSQYRVEENQVVTVDNLGLEKDSTANTNKVLLLRTDKETKIGQPYLDSTSVDYQVLKNYRGQKLRVFKYKAKSRYQKTRGFRAQLTDIKITKINL